MMMKNLIKNTILVLVMVFLGLFLVGCEKNNPEPVDVDKTELVVTLGDVDFLPFTYSVNNPNSVGDLDKVQNNVRKGESTKIVLPETVTKGTSIFVYTARHLEYAEIYEIDVKVNSKKYEVSYEEPVIETKGHSPTRYSVVYIIRIK